MTAASSESAAAGRIMAGAARDAELPGVLAGLGFQDELEAIVDQAL